MKMLIVTNMWPNSSKPYYGSYVEHEYKLLNECGHDVELVTINGRKSGGSNLAYLKAFIELLLHRLNNSSQFDVIYCTHAFCVFLSVSCGFKKIAYVNHEGEYFTGSILEKIKLLAYKLCRSARFVNRKMMSKIKYDGPKFFLPALINLDSISELSMHDAKNTLGLSDDINYIFFPGDPLRPEKNYNFVEEFKKKNKDFFQNNNIDILLGGSINQANMGIYYRASFVTLVTSIYESDGLVFRESLCNKRPFISFDVGNASVYSQYGGVLFDSEAGLLKFLRKELDSATEITYLCDDNYNYLSQLNNFLTIDKLT